MKRKLITRVLTVGSAASLLTPLAFAFPALASAAPAKPAPPSSGSDPFYVQPSGAAQPHGAVQDSRKVTVRGLSNAATAYQLQYWTTNPQGKAVTTVTTLLVPKNPASGTRDLVSYQTAEDSLTLDCSPSYTLRTGANGEAIAINALLGSGWDVVVPDYEGPKSEYAVGTMEGMATLDSIQAVESFKPAQLNGATTPVGLEGYSGGSIPATWANALQASYTPELNIVAATAGGLAPDPKQVLTNLDGGLAFGEIIAAGIGLNRAYPSFGLDSLLNAKGRKLKDKDAKDSGGCGSAIGSAPFGRVSQYTHYPSAQALVAVPRVKNVLDKLDLITRPAPENPTFYFHEIFDEFVPSGPVNQLNAHYCANGTPLEYVRGVTGEHLIGAVDYVLTAGGYLHSRFAGLPPLNTCPSGTIG